MTAAREENVVNDNACRDGGKSDGHAATPALDVRHTRLVRASHWINVVCMTILLMSGLQIFNAHPALYWSAVADMQDRVAKKVKLPAGYTLI